MLIYEKWITENDDKVRHLFGTIENIPSESDNQLVYKDAYGDVLSDVTLPNSTISYVDDGQGGILQVNSTDPSDIVTTFIGVNIKKQDNSLVNIIPGGDYTPEEKTVTSIEEDSTSTMVTTYSVGDALSVAGLKIKVTYINGSTEVIASNASGVTYDPTNGTQLTAENTKVTVTYKGCSCEITLTVS